MKINLNCPINSTSYGLTSLNFLKSLTKLGHEVSLFAIPSNEFIQADPSEHDLIRQCLSNAIAFDWSAPSVRIYHQWDLALGIGHGKKIGMTFFEKDRLKPNEVHQIRSLDRLIVPLKWAADVVKESVGVPCNVSVVPLGYDPSIFYPRENPRKDNKTVFFQAGKIEIRKGHDVLVDMFNAAFTPSDNVELWMSWHNQFLTKEETKSWEDLYKCSPLGDKIKFIPWLPTQKNLAEIMAQTDCGIFPSRAEGWGLESLEMLAMGKEIIITNNTAHTEYCNNDNAMLIECPDKEPAYDSKWFFGDGNWSKLGKDQVEQAVTYMRDVHRRKQSGKLNDYSDSVKEFTWDNSTAKLVEALQ